MRIRRRGTVNDHGWNELRLGKVRVSWDPEATHVELTTRKVSDFNGKSHHDYSVCLSLDDLSNIIGALGDVPVETHGQQLGQQFTPRIRELLRLVDACTGRIAR